MTPRLDTVIRLEELCVETLQVEDMGVRCCPVSSPSGDAFILYQRPTVLETPTNA